MSSSNESSANVPLRVFEHDWEQNPADIPFHEQDNAYGLGQPFIPPASGGPSESFFHYEGPEGPVDLRYVCGDHKIEFYWSYQASLSRPHILWVRIGPIESSDRSAPRWYELGSVESTEGVFVLRKQHLPAFANSGWRPYFYLEPIA